MRTTDTRAAVPLIGVLMMVSVVIIVAASVGLFTHEVSSELAGPAPVAEFTFEAQYLEDDVEKNDKITITH